MDVNLLTARRQQYEGKYRLEADGTLYVRYPTVTDPDDFCEMLSQLKGVRRACVDMQGSTKLTDRGLARALATMSLVRLSLDETHVTNAGVAALAGNLTLENLSLEENPFLSNASLPIIGTLLNLKQLNLAGCYRMSDGGEHIANLQSLHNPLCVPENFKLPFDKDKLPWFHCNSDDAWWHFITIDAKIKKCNEQGIPFNQDLYS